MTKLTTERLEELANATTPSVKYVGREIIAMARRLLAYEQAAKNPVAWVATDSEGFPEYSGHNEFSSSCGVGTPLYAAPVLPKQPEHSRQHFESLCNQFWNWAELDEIDQDEEPRLEWNGSNYTHRVTAALWKMYQAASAQPVIPEQTERERIRREHAEWSDATFGNVGPVGPLKHLSKEALEAAADPSDPLEWADMQFLLWDAQRRMGLSDEFITRAMIEKLEINKKRQWPEPKDGEPRLHINTQSAQPVSEPYRLPDGWVMVPQQIFLDASDIESICSQCGDGHKSGYGDFTDGLLWVGDIQCDNGTIMHGLHISSSDYQEEGGLTLAEFKAPVQESE
ncbi:DUF550 domain-containing protein [Hafnia paralvei]|uniref:DUF550 domain-containing protein n=1 Tax=Hafnia paralvei TaxID=546367 RepID=UPI0038D1523E